MNALRVLNTKERGRILSILEKQYGAPWEPEGVLLLNNRNRLFLATREAASYYTNPRVGRIGLYIGEVYSGELRLSMEGSQIIGKIAKKKVVELSDEEMREWLKGSTIERNLENGFYILSHKGDFLGCGKCVSGKILNYVPKERRVKTTN